MVDDTVTLRTLSSAPPEQWGACLEALGASVRPVEDGKDDDSYSGNPFTISSLLGMMAPRHVEGSSRASGALASRAPASSSTSSPGKPRRHRKALQPVVSAPAEEDKRDLDELLRELGEPCQPVKKVNKAVQNKKPKAGKASKQSRASATRRQAQVEECTRASSDEDAESDNSQIESMLVDRTAETVDLEEFVQADTVNGEKSAEIITSDVQESLDSSVAENCTLREPVVEMVFESPHARERTSLSHSLSEGNLPKACQFDCERTQEPTMPYRSPSYFCKRPSVATWISSTHKLWPNTTTNPMLNQEVASSSSASIAPSASAASALQPSQGCWSARPSVGTWLARPLRPPEFEHTQIQNLPSWRDGKDSSCAWPCTPTSTPSSSPRGYDNSRSGQVVWVPVPVHLLADVQRVIGNAWFAPS